MKIFKKNISLKEEIKKWLLFKKHTIKYSTYYRYKYLINKYILLYFENKNIYYFIDYDFNIYIDYLSLTLSSKTVKDIITIFKSILKYIERKYNIDYKLDLISSPRNNKSEIQILNDFEKIKLEQYCLENNTLKNIGIALCLNTGLRLGEICALKWENINIESDLILVDKTIQRVYLEKGNTKIQIDEPKTKKAIRKIPIPEKIIHQLESLQKINKYSGNEYFLTGSKKYIEPRTYQNIFKKCLKVCGIKSYNFHILRHTFATNCIKIGMDVKSLSELLGHSDVNITLNLYVHSSYETKKVFFR